MYIPYLKVWQYFYDLCSLLRKFLRFFLIFESWNNLMNIYAAKYIYIIIHVLYIHIYVCMLGYNLFGLLEIIVNVLLFTVLLFLFCSALASQKICEMAKVSMKLWEMRSRSVVINHSGTNTVSTRYKQQ